MEPDPGSFRDPDSRVVIEDGPRLPRAVPARRGGLRGVRRVSSSPATRASWPPGARGGRRGSSTSASRSSRTRTSGPSGCSRRAALLTLELVDAAIGEGLCSRTRRRTTSSSSGARPVFIDVGSFERLRRRRAVARLPPVLHAVPVSADAHRLPGRRLPAVAAGSLEGIEPAEAAALLPRQRGVDGERAAAGAAGGAGSVGAGDDLAAPKAASSRRSSRRTFVSWQGSWTPRVGRARATRVRRGTRGGSGIEGRFVREVAARVAPRLTWDLGANDGPFSRLVAGRGGRDGRRPRARRTGLFSSLEEGERILPLVVDVCGLLRPRGDGH